MRRDVEFGGEGDLEDAPDEWPLRGGHFKAANASSGSLAGLRRRGLGAVDLPFKLGEHEADVGGVPRPAMTGRPRPAGTEHPITVCRTGCGPKALDQRDRAAVGLPGLQLGLVKQKGA